MSGSTWKDDVRAVWPYATAASSLLFASCALVGLALAWQAGAKSAVSYVLAVTDPAFAALAMLAICVTSPGVYAGRRFQTLHAVTLPTLYMAVVYGIKSLSRSSAGSIQGVEGAQRFDLIWTDWRVVLQAWIVLVLALLLIRALLKGREEPAS